MFEKGILNLAELDKISESTSEFAPGSVGNKDVSNHVSGSTVSIPGGLKEQPTKEGIVMTTKEYDDALKQFKASFKEAADLIDTIRSIRIVENTQSVAVTKAQKEYLEDALDNAFVESYESGPIFEAVSRSDKDDVKKIVKNIRPKVRKLVKKDKYDFREANKVARFILGPLAGGQLGRGIFAFWSTRMWQILGICNVEEGNISELVKMLNTELKDDLGGYKVLAARMPANLIDAFKQKFGWKNVRETYHLLVDKKMPHELKAIKESVDEEVVDLIGEMEESAEETPKETPKENPITESVSTQAVRPSNRMAKLYNEYLINFAESNNGGSPYSLEEFSEAVSSFEDSGSLEEFSEKCSKKSKKKKGDEEDEMEDECKGKKCKKKVKLLNEMASSDDIEDPLNESVEDNTVIDHLSAFLNARSR